MDKKVTYFTVKYQRFKKRRGHRKVFIAITLMLLVCIYHMIQTRECFNPSDYEEFQNSAPKQQVFTTKTAIEFLLGKGYNASSLEKEM